MFQRHYILRDFGDRPGQFVPSKIKRRTKLRVEGPVDAFDNRPAYSKKLKKQTDVRRPSLKRALYSSVRYHESRF